MKVIDQINGSALFAQSAYSASIATKDSLGRNITATYLTGINIPESATWNDTSNVVQSNSAQWGQGGGGTTYTSPSGTILINDNTLEATTSAITQIADTASITYDDYFYVSSMPNYPYSTYKFKSDLDFIIVVASYGDWIYTKNYETDEQGFATIPSTFNGYDLTVVYCEGVLSGIKPNVVELATKSDLPTYQYDSSNKISAINGSAIAAGDKFPVSADEAIQYVQTNSANIDDTVTSYQNASASYLSNLTSPLGTVDIVGNQIESTNSGVEKITYASSYSVISASTTIIPISGQITAGYIQPTYVYLSSTNPKNELWLAFEAYTLEPDRSLIAFSSENAGSGLFDVSSHYDRTMGGYITASVPNENLIALYAEQQVGYGWRQHNSFASGASGEEIRCERLAWASEVTGGGGGITGEFVQQSAFNELKQSYDALSSLFATYSGQWLIGG